jgi:hypothetical protein
MEGNNRQGEAKDVRLHDARQTPGTARRTAAHNLQKLTTNQSYVRSGTFESMTWTSESPCLARNCLMARSASRLCG